jgi:hypothetical protein
MGQRHITLRLSSRIFIPLLFIIALIQPHASVRAEVILNYFRASSQSDGILIEWETSSEANSDGFYILRSLRQNQDFTRINIFFLSDSEAGEGVFYSYLDDQVVNGNVYYYKLEAIDQDGSSELFGPVTVGYKLQTATPTLTGTITPGLPITNLTNTPSPTRGLTTQPYVTPTPTRTGSIVELATQTLVPSATITGTITTIASETPTLEPLPTFELIFPAITATRAVTSTSISTPKLLLSEENRVSTIPPQPISSRNVFLLGIIILLWLTLIGFMVLWIWKFFQDDLEVEEENSE